MNKHDFRPCYEEECGGTMCSYGEGSEDCHHTKDHRIHQQESQPEHWCDKHQSLFSYHVVYGIRHYVCTLCFVDQPATHPAEGPRVEKPEVDPKCLSASQQDSLEYARGWVGHLDDNPIANDHNNCVIAAFEELAQAKQAGEYRSHLEAELLQAQIRIAELEKHAGGLINGGMASKEWSRAERQMRKLLEERRK